MNTKSCVNIKNEDNECFKWCVLAQLHPASSNACRVSKYKEFKDELDLTGIEFPFPVNNSKMIQKFENNNNVAINIFEGTIRASKVNPIPLYISKNAVEPGRIVDLLFIQSDENEGEIKSLSLIHI